MNEEEEHGNMKHIKDMKTFCLGSPKHNCFMSFMPFMVNVISVLTTS